MTACRGFKKCFINAATFENREVMYPLRNLKKQNRRDYNQRKSEVI